MNKGSSTVCYAFLKKLPAPQQLALTKYLPEEEATEFHQFSACKDDLTSGIPPLEQELSRTHVSWLAPLLRSLPEGDIRLFLGALSESQQNGLKASLLFSTHVPQLSSLGKTFLKMQLLSNLIAQEELLPLSCLPLHPLNALLSMSYEELLTLISLLSMHDLAVEIRQIIDTAKLKKIYAMLSSAQTNFLKTLIYRKEPVVFKKLELTKWDGRTETLAASLEQRGINRLAKALYTAERSLLWYISHRLDTERGAMLINLCTPLDHARAAILLSEQITDLLHALKNPET